MVTKSAGRLRLYVDTVMVVDRDAPGTVYYFAADEAGPMGDWDPTGTGGGVAIGRDADVAADHFDGWIDEVAVYDQALSRQRIGAHWTASGRTVPAASLPAGQRLGVGSLSAYGFSRDVSTSRSDPVDSATGAFVHAETDMRVAGPGVAFSLERSYNSTDTTTGPLGVGWAHSLNASLTVNGSTGDVTVRTPDGQQVLYIEDAGTYVPGPGILATLQSVAGGYLVTTHDTIRWRFDASGRLSAVEDAAGRGLTITHDASSRIDFVTDEAGAVYDFTYDGNGRLDTVAMPASDGRSVTFDYDTSGRLAEVVGLDGRAMRYSYDSASRLTQVRRVTYEPDGSGGLDEVGEVVEVRNEYDTTTGRVHYQWDALDNRSEFTWDSGTQTATLVDAAGATWIDETHDGVLLGSTEPVGAGGSGVTSSVSYDASLNPATVVDARGNEWLADYDEFGNVVTRTRPAPFDAEVESWSYDYPAFPTLLTSYTNGRGYTTTYDYDAQGRLVTETQLGEAGNADDLSTVYDYTPVDAGCADIGQVTTVTDPRDGESLTCHDAVGRVVWSQTAEGLRTAFSYDARGFLIEKIDPAGNGAPVPLPSTCPGTSVAFTAWSNCFRWRYDYDDKGRLIEQITPPTDANPNGQVTQYEYDLWDATRELEFDRVVEDVGGLNWTTITRRNAAGEVVEEVQPGGRVTTTEYDERGLVTAIITPEGERTTNCYDDAGRLVATVDPRGYSPSVDVCTHASAAPYRAAFGYDANGNQVRDAIPDPNEPAEWVETLSEYDALDRVSQVTDPEGHVTEFGYDANGNQITTIRYDNGQPLVSIALFDVFDRQFATIDPRGYAGPGTSCAGNAYCTSFGYDLAGNQVSVTTPAGDTTVSEYDLDGRLTATIDSRGYGGPGTTCAANPHCTAYGYDANGNQVSVTPPGLNAVVSAFDPVGQVVARTEEPADGTFSTTQWRYDALGRLTAVVAADGTETEYTHDPTTGDLASRIARRDDPGLDDVVTTYDSYDDNGRLLEMSDPNSGSRSYTYDEAGNRTVEELSGGLGSIVSGYDPLGRLAAVDYRDATPANFSDDRQSDVAYVYDRNGNRVQMLETRPDEDEMGGPDPTPVTVAVTLYEYDGLDRVTGVTRDSTAPFDGADGAPFAYTYDAASNPDTRTYSDGTVVDWDVDGTGRLSTVTSGSDVTTYTYDAANHLATTTMPNGFVETRVWDNPGRLLSVEADRSGVTVGRNVYAYDEVGKPTSVVDPTGMTTFHRYDARNRLTRSCFAADCGSGFAQGDIQYGFDDVGNILTETRPVGTTTFALQASSDRLVSQSGLHGGGTAAYDAVGNLTNDGHGHVYSYDLAGRMTSSITTNEWKSYWQRIAETAPVGWWRLGEPAGATSARDASGHNHHTVSYLSVPTFDQAGVLPGDGDRAVWFNGAGNNLIADVSADLTGSYSLEAWVQPDTSPPAGAQTILAFTNGNTTSLRINQAGHVLLVTPAKTVQTSGTAPIAFGAANHIVVTYDAATTTARIYVDGVLEKIDTSTPALSTTPATVVFGTSAAGSFKGVMDELALYTTALPANVVTSHNQAGRLQLAARHVAHDAPLAWWRLGEPSGVTAIDATGNGYPALGAVFTLLTPDRDATGLLAGDPDRAAKFNGTNDHFTTSSTTGPPITNSSFSIEAWVKPDSGTTAKDMAIYGQHAAATSGNSLSLRIINGKVRFSLGGTNFDTTTSPITYGAINHVVVTYDQPSDTARIYVNGSLIQTKTAMGGPFLAATPPAANIGAHYFTSSTQKPFQGIIDDVAVYNRVLDATAIGEHHAGATSPPSPGFFDWIYENYHYDGDGRRVRTDTPFNAPLLTRIYEIDTTLPNGQLAVERDGLGTVQASYTYGYHRISQSTEIGTAYFHPDMLGSTTSTTNTEGGLAYRQTYEPYGTTQLNDPTTGTSAFQYTGEHHDTTGLYHLRARQYDPGAGRFTGPDPLARGINDPYASAYAYANNNPLAMVDAAGLRATRAQPDPWETLTAGWIAQPSFNECLGGVDPRSWTRVVVSHAAVEAA